MLRKVIQIAILVFLFSTSLCAQTAKWAVSPTEQKVENKKELLKVKTDDGKTLLMDNDGQLLFNENETFDSISDFCGGYALAMNNVGNKYRIEAVIHKDEMKVETLAEPVYVGKFQYFSEGLMPVEGDNGWGYLGTDGNIVIPCYFKEAYPFSRGLAAVNLKGYEYYIDADFDFLSIDTEYKLRYAFTFSGDSALVIDFNYGGFYVNRKGQAKRIKNFDYTEVTYNDDDHMVCGDTLLAPSVERIKTVPPVNDSFQLFQDGKYWGYTHNGDIVVPAQFDKAEAVRGDYALVEQNGKLGTIRFIDGEVSASLITSDVDLNNDGIQKQPVFLRVDLPTEFAESDIQLLLYNKDGEIQNTKMENKSFNSRTFSSQLSHLKSNTDEDITIAVVVDGLILWNGVGRLHVNEKKMEKNDEQKTKEIINVPTRTPSDPPKPLPKNIKTDKAVQENIIAESKKTNPSANKPAKKPAKFILTSAPRQANKKGKADPDDNFFVSVEVKNVGETTGTVTVSLKIDNKSGQSQLNIAPGKSRIKKFKIANVKKRKLTTATAILPNGESKTADIELMPFRS